MKIDYGKEIKRIVVKVGTSTLTHVDGQINLQQMEEIVKDIAELYTKGHEVVLVSSGAVGAGSGRINKKTKPKTLPEKQAIAAIGQVALMHRYEQLFRTYGIVVGQVLLTKDDLTNRKRNLNAKNTLGTLLSMGAIPIINENDTVAVDEIKLGDNDRLAAYVAALIDADILMILTDIDGLYTSNPSKGNGGVLVEKVEKITPEIEAYAGGEGTLFGTGGMATKIMAAKIGTSAGVYVLIGNSHNHSFMVDALRGDVAGTVFIPHNRKIQTKKKWLLISSKAKGKVFVDDGAKDALMNEGKSLLPIGITGTEGSFAKGDVVSVRDAKGFEIGRGITYYGSKEIDKIQGRKTKEIEGILGEDYEYDTVIHRDNLSVNPA